MRKLCCIVMVIASMSIASIARAAQPSTPAPARPPAGPGVSPANPNSTGASSAAGPTAAGPTAGVGGETLLTIEQLNAQLAEGKYQEVLKHVSKLLQLRGYAGNDYGRYELLCLRGEAALRGKTNSMAMDAFA